LRLEGLSIGAAYAKGAWRIWSESKTGLVESKNWFNSFSCFLKNEPELIKILKHPSVSLKEKRSLLSSVCKNIEADEDFSLFLNIIVKNGKIEYFDQIAQNYEELVDEHEGVRRGVLELTNEIPEKILHNFEKDLGKKLDCKVVLKQKTVKGLIGGFKLRMGRYMVDASVQNSLKKIKKSLAGN
tara:strand:- start:1125 stop:1676 length:552 start_codon:yes stop_codon:yes gene_type:complete